MSVYLVSLVAIIFFCPAMARLKFILSIFFRVNIPSRTSNRSNKSRVFGGLTAALAAPSGGFRSRTSAMKPPANDNCIHNKSEFTFEIKNRFSGSTLCESWEGLTEMAHRYGPEDMEWLLQ